MKWQDFINDYLSFTRKERIGMLVIASLVLFIFFLPEIISKFSKPGNIPVDTAWLSAVSKLEVEVIDSAADYFPKNVDDNLELYRIDKPSKKYLELNSSKIELFYFDPNILSESGWKKLGIRDKTIRTIKNFLSSGGKFKIKEDLLKIYGLKKDEFERLEPFIKINETKAGPVVESLPLNSQSETVSEKKLVPRFFVIEINSADTTALISLPGIGSKLAVRIINFREKLGGFYSIEQVGETFGLPDSTFQKIKQYLRLEISLVKKININTATVDELKAHPYIKYSLANPIVAYRNEHGLFSGIEEIKKVIIVTDEIYKKISPYIAIQ